MTRGKFLVIYGSNNLGKSLQVKMLEEFVRSTGRETVLIKYPIYDSPTGEIIDAILRPKRAPTYGLPEGMNVPDEYLQWLFAKNRRDFEPTLGEMMKSGKWPIAEDYYGTGFAWGLTKGVERAFLDMVNKDLLEPDWSALLDAERRFTNGIEKGHRHEDAGESLWQRNREMHLQLAKEFSWEIVQNADRNPEIVHGEIVDRLLASGLL